MMLRKILHSYKGQLIAAVAVLFPLIAALGAGNAQEQELDTLIRAVSGDTPQYQDLQYLTDVIGGRTTGSPANVRAVNWTLKRFKDAGVTAHKESFTMPKQWIERATTVEVQGEGIRFSPRAVAKQYSPTTEPGGLTGPLIHVGFGTEADFNKAGDAVKGGWILAQTQQVVDLGGVMGRIQAGSRGRNSGGKARRSGHHLYVAPRRGFAAPPRLAQWHRSTRCFCRAPGSLAHRAPAQPRSLVTANVTVDASTGGEFESYNVVADIEGSDLKDEIVLIGAHIDSHSLGTGALDNGGNVSLLIDLARQMRRLGIRPRRTARFVLWNGEEQGFHGCWGYTVRHKAELDKHVIAASIDTGEGPIVGFFTAGRGAELRPILDRILAPVAHLGPFEHHDAALVGTDNYDFMLNGVANLVSNQGSTELGPHYHAETDTLDRVDPKVLKHNAAILAALVYGFANVDVELPRQFAAEVKALIEQKKVRPGMEGFGVYEAWLTGERAWIETD